MEGVIFEKASDYIASCSTIDAKIVAIDAVILKLLDAAAKSADNGNIGEYWFDDGHVKIRNVYKSAKEIYDSINSFETLRNKYVAMKTGRVTRLMDSSNFIGGC